MSQGTVTIRDARADDHDDVTAMCEGIWAERNGDYLPHVYPDWIRGDDRRTRVAVRDGDVVGIAQCVLLSPTEGWSQGLRVREDARGQGVAQRIVADLFAWAAEQGALVVRSMVFSWNQAGMGAARSMGFEPTTAFRFASPIPRTGALPDTVVRDACTAWHAWTTSDARSALAGLCLDDEESWAMRELHRADLQDECALAVVDDGLAGMALRGRCYEARSSDHDRVQEYAASAWRDATAAETLFQAIAVDAASVGADATRVVVPEEPTFVADVGAQGIEISTEPHFVFAADLTSVLD